MQAIEEDRVSDTGVRRRRDLLTETQEREIVAALSCPYEGEGPEVLRAVVAAIGAELWEQGSTYGPALFDTIARCNGLDFAAGWYVAQMSAEDGRAALERLAMFLAGAVRLAPANVLLLRDAARLTTHEIEARLDALPGAEARPQPARVAFTMYATFALSTTTSGDSVDQCARDVVRAFFDATAAELGDERARGMLQAAIALMRAPGNGETASAGTRDGL